MENSDVVDALHAAERSFEQSPENIEDGLDVDEAELVQLRRACRLLAAASRLLEEGYYTVVIESSFVAIERTIQFRLIHDDAMEASAVISSHRRLYQRGAEGRTLRRGIRCASSRTLESEPNQDLLQARSCH